MTSLSDKGSVFEWVMRFEFNDNRLVNEWSATSTPPIRVKQNISLAFPATDFTVEKKGQDWVLEQAVIGLAGVDGPLPRAWSESLWQEKNVEPARIDFLNIFNHQLFLLFWRAYAHTTLITSINRERSFVHHFVNATCIRALGSPLSAALTKDLPSSALWMNRQSSTGNLKTLLERLCATQVELCEFIPYWMQIAKEEQVELGAPTHRLGIDTLIGERVLTSSEALMLKVGPVKKSRFLQLVDAQFLNGIFRLARDYINRPLIIIINVGLEKNAPPEPIEAMRLNVNSRAGNRQGECWAFFRVNQA